MKLLLTGAPGFWGSCVTKIIRPEQCSHCGYMQWLNQSVKLKIQQIAQIGRTTNSTPVFRPGCVKIT